MNKQELALQIGNHILKCIKQIEDEKMNFGQSLKITLKLPHNSNEPDWLYSIQLDMPRYIYSEIVDGRPEYKSITMAEYYGWDNEKNSRLINEEKLKEMEERN